ncbi:MAG: PilZ domain-containing protein [Candidatus Scalindua sp.]|nr:PilZ domain-containing protein [Candidatus Scalindua sp.]
MEIITKQAANQSVNFIEVVGDLISRESLILQEYLFACLDEGKYFQLIDLKHVQKIDGLGINIFDYFIKRGILIRLFNVQTDIRSILRLSGKEDIIVMINETDSEKAISLVNEEILKIGDTVKDRIKRRQHARAMVFGQKEFKYQCSQNGVIQCVANVLNLSKGGIFSDLITAVGLENGKLIDYPSVNGKRCFEIKIKLFDELMTIETDGVCVWQDREKHKTSIGVRFEGIKKEGKKLIHHYLSNPLP